MVLVLLLGGLVWLTPLLPNPQEVLFWRGGRYSDLLVTHWPNAVLLGRSLREWRQVPLWNPQILSGIPFFADPLSGLWYPPLWLAAGPVPGLKFNLLIYGHLVWAGWGTWRLARRLGIDDPAAGLAGLAFSGTPRLLGHVGLGHLTLVCAVGWIPWLLVAVERAVQPARASLRRRLLPAAGAGALAALIFLIDPRGYPIALLVAVPFGIWRFAHSHAFSLGVAARRGLPSLLAAGSVSLGLAAGLAFPLAEFVRLSTRVGLGAESTVEFSLPAGRLGNLLVPDYAVWPEWQTYPGAVVLGLAGVGLVGQGRRQWFWPALAVGALALGLGEALPVQAVLRSAIPGFGLLRVPARFVILSSFAVVMLAGAGLARLLGSRPPVRAATWIGLGLGGLALLAGGLRAGRSFEAESQLFWAPYLLSATWLAAGVAWAWLGRKATKFAWAGWMVLILVDLGSANRLALEVRPGAGAIDEQVRAIAARAQTRPPSRVYSPSYSLPQPAAARLGAETADGIHPLQLQSYRDYLSKATGLSAPGYSVTLPPYPAGDPQVARAVDLDPERLGLLSVAEVVSAYPLEAKGFEGSQISEGNFRYFNPAVRPRAWLEDDSVAGWRPAEFVEWTPNRIQIRASGPGKLVLSEIDYPGWRATVDGEPVPLGSHLGLLRAVELPPGQHLVRFEFRPASLYAGLAVSAVTALALVSLWIRR